MAGVITSPADFVSNPAKVMPTLNNNRSACGSIRHFLFRTRHLSSRTRKGCMRNKQRLLPHTVFLPRGFCRTRQIFRLVRSISRRHVMFTKIASPKKTPDAGKNLRVLQIFRCVEQKLTLQPFFFRKKTHGSGIILAGKEKNVRA